MKTLIPLFLVAILLIQPTLVGQTLDDAWSPVAEGIDYQQFRLPDPNNVFVARMDRSNLSLTIESSIAHGGLSGSLEPVSSMAAHAEQAINYWGGSFTPTTWGARNDVVVAINGSYFSWDTYIMEGGLIHSGWYAKRFEDCGGFTGFAWTLNRVPFIGENVWQKPEKNIVVFPETETSMEINGVNQPRNSDELVMYTPQYDESTLTNDKGVEVLVELTRPTMLLPEPWRYAQGFIRSIRVNAGDTSVPFDHVVLSASGNITPTLLSNSSIGAEVRISQELTPGLADSCNTLDEDIDWTKTFASVQGHYYFLKNGVINPYDSDPNATDREPRTAIAYNDQYIFFIVVDGRDPLNSIGMTVEQLAGFARDTLGATNAVAHDGGGSSTMVVNGVVVNNVFCNNVYCVYDHQAYLPFVVKQVTPELIDQQAQVQMVLFSDTYERAVPNGMMMVVVETPLFTDTFTVTQQVFLSETAYVYSGPGTNFHVLDELPKGTSGVVIDALSELNGVWARNAYWWRVDFGSLSGWVKQSALSAK